MLTAHQAETIALLDTNGTLVHWDCYPWSSDIQKMRAAERFTSAIPPGWSNLIRYEVDELGWYDEDTDTFHPAVCGLCGEGIE